MRDDGINCLFICALNRIADNNCHVTPGSGTVQGLADPNPVEVLTEVKVTVAGDRVCGTVRV
jgi:hypothetical protein